MSSRNYLAVLTILGFQLTTVLSFHIPIHRSSNHTLGNHLVSTAAARISPLHNDDQLVCFEHRVLPISLATCEPALRMLESSPDVDFRFTYGGGKQERVPIVEGPCTINLFAELYRGITGRHLSGDYTLCASDSAVV